MCLCLSMCPKDWRGPFGRIEQLQKGILVPPKGLHFCFCAFQAALFALWCGLQLYRCRLVQPTALRLPSADTQSPPSAFLCAPQMPLPSSPLRIGSSGLPPCPQQEEAGGRTGHTRRFGSGGAPGGRFPALPAPPRARPPGSEGPAPAAQPPARLPSRALPPFAGSFRAAGCPFTACVPRGAHCHRLRAAPPRSAGGGQASGACSSGGVLAGGVLAGAARREAAALDGSQRGTALGAGCGTGGAGSVPAAAAPPALVGGGDAMNRAVPGRVGLEPSLLPRPPRCLALVTDSHKLARQRGC
ncbi:uncharacterized protein LOC142365348 [Opisthocomus hoazin]|uniref:uncharacterized protein LOC142365348 n=1 Tax=Opisthocomus hoazin TaxID=30419 RepID=UPI003F52B1E0